LRNHVECARYTVRPMLASQLDGHLGHARNRTVASNLFLPVFSAPSGCTQIDVRNKTGNV
jgi:hypothetical protein